MREQNLTAIFSSERLKLKKTKRYSLLFSVTLAAPVLAYLIGGVLIFIPFTLYWWEALFLFLLGGLLFLSDVKREKSAGDFQNIESTAVKKQIYFAKVALNFRTLFEASFILFGAIYLVALLYGGLLRAESLRLIVVILALLVTSLWNIFFIYYLSNWLNASLVVVINSLLCLFIAPLVAQTKLWLLFPYTYHYKVAEALIGLKPNGVQSPDFLNIDWGMFGSSVGSALLSAVLFSWLLGRRSDVQNSKK